MPFINSARGIFGPQGRQKSKIGIGRSQDDFFSSPVQASNFNFPAGTYWFKSPSMSSALQMYYEPNYYEGKPWVRVFRSAVSSTADINLLGNSIDWEGLLVQRNTLDIRATGYYSAKRLYNERGNESQSDLTTSGTRAGYRVYLGYAGGHGFYNTAQGTCSWGGSDGGVGAGWNGSTCGSFPNDLKWGTGTSSASYTNISGTWEHWIYWT
jgi:hypothetical protein